jgi:hypothetical protein
MESVQVLLTARDIMREDDFPVFSPEDSLAEVMRRFGTYRFEAPIIEGGRLIGSIWPEDVIRRYNAEVFKRDMASSMSLTVSRGPSTEPVPGVRGMSLSEIPVPGSFVGKSIADVDIRRRFDTTVLLIKRRVGDEEEVTDQLPDANHVFREGDVMLVMGKEDDLYRLGRTG